MAMWSDYLRLLYARAGTPHCPTCDAIIDRQTPQQIVDQVLEMEAGLRFQVLAPVVRTRKGEFVDLFADLAAQGYARARVDGETYQLTDPPTLKKQVKHELLLGQAKSDRKEIMSGFQPSKQGADMDTPPLRDGAEIYRACSPAGQ